MNCKIYWTISLFQGPLDLEVSLALLVHKETLVQLGQLDLLGQPEQLDQLGLLGQPEQLDPLVPLEQLVQLVLLGENLIQ